MSDTKELTPDEERLWEDAKRVLRDYGANPEHAIEDAAKTVEAYAMTPDEIARLIPAEERLEPNIVSSDLYVAHHARLSVDQDAKGPYVSVEYAAGLARANIALGEALGKSLEENEALAKELEKMKTDLGLNDFVYRLDLAKRERDAAENERDALAKEVSELMAQGKYLVERNTTHFDTARRLAEERDALAERVEELEISLVQVTDAHTDLLTSSAKDLVEARAEVERLKSLLRGNATCCDDNPNWPKHEDDCPVGKALKR